MNRDSAPVMLAKESLEHFLATGDMLPVPAEVPLEMQGQAGTFVSLKKNGQLRGCIGTLQPTQSNIASEIIHNAVSAGIDDTRFWPVEPEELQDITVSVDVLEQPERVESIQDLDPQKYGIIVARGQRRGLLLPMLDGVDTAEQQISIAMQKAGIDCDEEIELYRFTVTRYT